MKAKIKTAQGEIMMNPEEYHDYMKSIGKSKEEIKAGLAFIFGNETFFD